MRNPLLAIAAFGGSVAVVWACSSDDPPGAPNVTADAAPSEDVVVTSPDAAVATNTLYTSGTRLRAEVYTLEGAALLDGFFDTKRAEGCGFTTTSGGAHCLPPAMTLAYLDAACTQPVAVRQTCDQAVTYAIQGESTGVCPGDVRSVAEIRPVGAPLASPGDVYLRNAGGECQVSQGWSLFFSVGEPIPLAEFVHATKVRVDMSSAVAAEKLVGDDGSSVVTDDLVDRSRDAGCQPSRLGPPSSTNDRCISSARGFFDTRRGPFADPSCTEPAAAPIRREGCPAPSGAIRATEIDAGTGCAGYDFTFVTLGDPVASGFRLAGNACLPGSELAHFRLGAPVAEDTLPAVPLARFGNGRMRVTARASEGTRVANGRLWDEQEKSECSLVPFADGKTYCVPNDISLGDQEARFRDAACTQEVLFVGCTPLKYKVSLAAAGCIGGPRATNIHPLGPVSDVAEYYVLDNGTCTGPQTFGAGPAQDVLAPVDVATRLSAAPVRTRE